MAQVIALFTAVAARKPMQAQSAVRAHAGRGLDGDRYCLGEGSYSRGPRKIIRHVSIIAKEDIERSNDKLTRKGLAAFELGETRRNIVVEGVDVTALLGREFRIGAVTMRGIEPTRPCPIPSEVANKEGFKEAYHNRGGILAEIVSDGIICIGDQLNTM